MHEPRPAQARQIAETVARFERERAGLRPRSVTAVLGGDTLAVTLRGALSPAERSVACAPEGDALLRQFHRELFASGSGPLRQELTRLTGAEVLEASAEAQASVGNLVLVFLLAADLPPDAWTGVVAD